MVVTDIKIRKFFNEGPMKAVVSVTFDGALAVHDVKVINAKDKFFIVMPSRKNPDGTYRDIVHPINSDFRAELEGAVIKAYFDGLATAEFADAEETDAEWQFAKQSVLCRLFCFLLLTYKLNVVIIC